MKDKKELIRKVKFTLFSISAGIIQIILFTILNEILKLEYEYSYLIALIASVIWNFTLNREYTFKSVANVPKAMIKVAIFYMIFTPASTLIGKYLVNTVHINEYIVTGFNMLCNFVLEYLYDKYVVFRGTIDTKVKKKKGN